MKHYIVRKSHQSSFPDPIILQAGQEVLYGAEDTEYPNWIFCTSLFTDKSGWVPKQMLTTPDDSGIAKVLEDYSAHELTVLEGESLLGLKHLNAWTYCKTEKGELGWVPTTCLHTL